MKFANRPWKNSRNLSISCGKKLRNSIISCREKIENFQSYAGITHEFRQSVTRSCKIGHRKKKSHFDDWFARKKIFNFVNLSQGNILKFGNQSAKCQEIC